MHQRLRELSRGLGCALALASAAPLAAAPEDFPKPAAIEPRVAFWKRIYTGLGTGGGVLHDSNDLSLVYEVVELPNGRWDASGERHVRRRREHVAAVLRALSRGKRSGLSQEEEHILSLFPMDVSSRTLRDAAVNARFQLGQADKFRAGIARQGRWEAYIRNVFSERGLPVELGALPHVESSFNPEARSSVGASGIWQFMPSTGRLFLRVNGAVDERNDPYIATVAAARLLKSNYENIGSWPLALTAYNHGLGGMQRAVQRLGTRDIGVIVEKYESRSFGFASQNFYSEFYAAMEIDREPERYFGPIPRDPPEDLESVVLDHYYRASALANAFGVPLSALRDANLGVNDAVWAGKRHLPQGYELRVPRDPLRAAPKVVLASIPSSERLAVQVVERPGSHRVRRGETLSTIARRYGVSARAIARENGLRSVNQIRVGQRLRIPGLDTERVEVAQAAAPTTAAPAPAAALEAAPTQGVYRVRRGDTLASISRRFGVSAGDLARVNRISNPNQIHPGQLIELPGGSLNAEASDRSHAGVYTVQRGDTLDSIARQFSVSVRDLLALNEIRNKHRIAVGQRIYVPGPAEPAPASAPAPALAATLAANTPAPAAAALASAGAAAAAASTEAATPAVAPTAAAADPVPSTMLAGAAAQPDPTAAAPAANSSAYTVRPGDTLASISRDLGIPIQELAHANRIRNTSRIQTGQQLALPGSSGESLSPDIAASASATPDAPPPAPTPSSYTVQRGDTLDSISRELGIPIEELAERNGIRNRSRIQVGQELQLSEASAQAGEPTPPLPSALASSSTPVALAPDPAAAATSTTYTVQRGDTLDSISRKLGISIEELAERNGIRNKSRIRVGQQLALPEPSEPPAPEATPSSPAPESSAAPDVPAAAPLETVVAQ